MQRFNKRQFKNWVLRMGNFKVYSLKHWNEIYREATLKAGEISERVGKEIHGIYELKSNETKSGNPETFTIIFK